MQDVVDCCVVGVSALAPPTAQAMSGKVIDGGCTRGVDIGGCQA